MNIIEKAVLNKTRFPSNKGMLTISQIAELPLQSKTNISLDSVAISIQENIDSAPTRSFVTSTTPANILLREQLEVVKHVIAYRLEERETALNAVKKSTEKQKLLRILANKKDDALEGKTQAELEAMIAAL
jgi:hypothetical protein